MKNVYIQLELNYMKMRIIHGKKEVLVYLKSIVIRKINQKLD